MNHLKNESVHCMTTPYWCREQNFRKYFETRKRHGIKPSIDYKTFYNRDKCDPYYQGLVEAMFMENKMEKLK